MRQQPVHSRPRRSATRAVKVPNSKIGGCYERSFGPRALIWPTSIIVGAILLLSGSVFAQDTRFDVQRFRPMPSQRSNFIGQAATSVMPHMGWEVGLTLNYADDPLIVRDEDDTVLGSLVASQLTSNLLFTLALIDRLELGLDVPLVLYQSGEAISLLPSATAEGGFGIGDIRFVPKVLIHDQATEDDESGLAIAFVLDTYIPVGNNDEYQGEGFRIHPRFVLDYDLTSGTRFGINLGYQVRPEASLVNVDSNDNFTVGLAADIVVTDQLSLVPEVSFEASVLSDELASEELASEFLLGSKYWANQNIMVELGMGTGIFPGYGSPDWRVMLGFTYSQAEEAEAVVLSGDRDGDGYLDDVDGCPDNPEDFDEFEDEDGCPDPDNDADGILDIDDLCPMDPEDVDLFEDEDGCPDPDNDNDSILDINDVCPMDPEDFDLFEDEDGCPEPDNDQDLILDFDDECPMDPEVYNGLDDEDGCPDETQITIVECMALELGDAVYFDTDSDVIQERSYPLLFDLTNALGANPSILKARVEGHTDSRGSDAHNLDLSQRRAAAVMRFVISAGIDEGRLESEGYGEAQPIDTNDTGEGRQNNRRVEVRILEQEGCD